MKELVEIIAKALVITRMKCVWSGLKMNVPLPLNFMWQVKTWVKL